MYDRFEYYGAPDIDREMRQSEAKMGAPIAWGAPPKLTMEKSFSFDRIKKGQKISFVNQHTMKKQVLTVTGKSTSKSGGDVYLVGRGGSTYGLHFHKGQKEPNLVRYGGKARGGMRPNPTDVRFQPGSIKIEEVSIDEACGKSHKKKKQGVKWHGITAVVKKEEIEDELQRLESTTSPFPEVRERRIEELKDDLEEAKKQYELDLRDGIQKIGREFSIECAHEFAKIAKRSTGISNITVWIKEGIVRVYFPGNIGYVTVGQDGTINSNNRGRVTFYSSAMQKSWSTGIDKAFKEYNNHLPKLLAKKEAKINDFVGKLEKKHKR